MRVETAPHPASHPNTVFGKPQSVLITMKTSCHPYAPPVMATVSNASNGYHDGDGAPSQRAKLGVNSTTMRAIKVLLSDPAALTMGKVCILVGGPDWPTSVSATAAVSFFNGQKAVGAGAERSGVGAEMTAAGR